MHYPLRWKSTTTARSQSAERLSDNVYTMLVCICHLSRQGAIVGQVSLKSSIWISIWRQMAVNYRSTHYHAWPRVFPWHSKFTGSRCPLPSPTEPRVVNRSSIVACFSEQSHVSSKSWKKLKYLSEAWIQKPKCKILMTSFIKQRNQNSFVHFRFYEGEQLGTFHCHYSGH